MELRVKYYYISVGRKAKLGVDLQTGFCGEGCYAVFCYHTCSPAEMLTQLPCHYTINERRGREQFAGSRIIYYLRQTALNRQL